MERSTADPGDVSSIPARSHTFAEIDHEIISMVVLLLPLIQEGLLSVTGYWVIAGVVRWTDRLDMTIAVDSEKNN